MYLHSREELGQDETRTSSGDKMGTVFPTINGLHQLHYVEKTTLPPLNILNNSGPNEVLTFIFQEKKIGGQHHVSF
jgi:hypothetical protein